MNEIDRPLNVLLIEDNPLDAVYTKEVLKDSKFPVRCYTIEDGKEALAFIRRSKYYENAIIPDLILLDLQLPYVDGFDLLTEIKENSDFRNIPVIVLTTSTVHNDVKKAHKLNAYFYMVKPLDIDEFDIVLARLKKSGLLKQNNS